MCVCIYIYIYIYIYRTLSLRTNLRAISLDSMLVCLLITVVYVVICRITQFDGFQTGSGQMGCLQKCRNTT